VTDARFAQLRLLRTHGIGPVTWRQLMARFGEAEVALDALPHLARRGGGEAPKAADPAVIAREIETVARLGARHVLLGDADYPALLAELDTAPPALIVRGDIGLAQCGGVALVGARNASAASCRFARGLAQDLAAQNVPVTSGLARGIDIAFPPENARLQEDVATRGLLIAEQPPGTQPLARHFPSRNRIIAGLAQGTVVVEAAPRSGSLITARLAGEAGREVMAVPGHPADPRAQGCNMLIHVATVARAIFSQISATFRYAARRRPRLSKPTPNPGDQAPNDEAGGYDDKHSDNCHFDAGDWLVVRVRPVSHELLPRLKRPALGFAGLCALGS